MGSAVWDSPRSLSLDARHPPFFKAIVQSHSGGEYSELGQMAIFELLPAAYAILAMEIHAVPTEQEYSDSFGIMVCKENPCFIAHLAGFEHSGDKRLRVHKERS